MTDDNDIDMLAAEFVIGTLDADERADVAARRMRDPVLDRAIRTWEERLSPWLQDYDSENAPADLKEKVLDAIGEAETPAAPHQGGDVVALSNLRRELSRWRAAAAIGYALAAGLAAFAIFAGPQSPESDRFVAVFQADDAQPAFIMSIDLSTREILIRPVTAKPAQGKTYQLWIASDQLGETPKSLGLLDDGSKPVRKSLPYDPALLQKATFGISLEPQGGSPIGRPTGPAIHGRLISTDL